MLAGVYMTEAEAEAFSSQGASQKSGLQLLL